MLETSMGMVRFNRVLVGLAVAVAAGCGGDSSTGPQGPAPNFVSLVSDAGDWVGQGERYNYTQANAIVSVAVSGSRLTVGIQGDEIWHGEFQMPAAATRLQPGTYGNLDRYPFHDPTEGGLSWSGEGRGCNTLSGSFTIDTVRYSGDTLTALNLRFEQHCEGGAPALRGTIHWRRGDLTRPPAPASIPVGLWRPPPAATPASGDYVVLQSDPGDFIGQGFTHTYTPANSTITVTATGGRLSVSVSGAQQWSGDFQAMSGLSRLQPGYYPDLQRFPFHNPMKGGLSWTGGGRGCNTLVGWFAIDDIRYTGSTLTGLDLRFEQRCEGGTPALHGAIRWGV